MAQTWSDLDEWERRTLLKTLGPAGLGLIAGCIGDDGGDSDVPTPDVPTDGDTDGDGDDGDTDTDDGDDEPGDLVDPRDYVIEGQTFRIPMDLEDPETAHFIGRDVGASIYSHLGSTATQAQDVANGRLAHGPGFHSAFNMEFHDPISHIYVGTADELYTPEIMRTEVIEEATWSDGEPVKARDYLLGMLGNGCVSPSLPSGGFYDAARAGVEFPDGQDGKILHQIAFDSWLGDGPDGMDPPEPKEEFLGWREMAPNVVQGQHLGQRARFGGLQVHAPSHIPPFDCQLDHLWEAHSFKWQLIEENPGLVNDAERYREWQENDPDGRTEFFRLFQEKAPAEWVEPWGGQLCRDGATRLCVGEGDDPAVLEAYERSRDPEWMTSLGLYEIDEIVGTEGYRLVPNENHWLYDEHTFDEVFVEWVQEDHREVAGLMAERYDSSGIALSPEEQNVVPDAYSLKTFPASSGFSLSLNHGYWPGQSVHVRQGLKFATDEAAVASNLNPETNAPITTPGLDNWGAEEFIDLDWGEENLTSYEYDLERAEELFERAGFELQGGNWHDANGVPIEEVIATDADAPVAEETIADQWREFGIQIDTLAMDSTTLQERWEGVDDPLGEGIGELAVAANMYPTQQTSGFFSAAVRHVSGANTFTYRRRARNWFDESGGHGTPEEKVEYTERVIREGFAPINYQSPGSHTTHWLIPPAGQFDAPQSEWVPFNHPRANIRAERGLYEWTGDLQPIDEPDQEDPVYQPDLLGVDDLWQALAWSINWFLPDLPITRNQAESYINTSNWLWGRDIPEVSGIATDLDTTYAHWDFWGLGTPGYQYPGNNMVWGDPENPKLGASVQRM